MPGPFIEEVPIDEDHTKGTYMKAGHEEDILETFPEVKEGDEVQPQTKDVGKELPSTTVVTRIDAFKSPLRGVLFYLLLPLRCLLLRCSHYS